MLLLELAALTHSRPAPDDETFASLDVFWFSLVRFGSVWCGARGESLFSEESF